MNTILTISIFIVGIPVFFYSILYSMVIFIFSVGYLVYSKKEREKSFKQLRRHVNKTYKPAVIIYIIFAMLVLIEVYC